MTETVDATAIRRALDQSRGQRTQITRGAPLPIDTAHVVGACPNCGHVGATILGSTTPGPAADAAATRQGRRARQGFSFPSTSIAVVVTDVVIAVSVVPDSPPTQ